jgi:hypothetical protein
MDPALRFNSISNTPVLQQSNEGQEFDSTDGFQSQDPNNKSAYLMVGG